MTKKRENTYSYRDSPQGARGLAHIGLYSLRVLHWEDKPPEILVLTASRAHFQVSQTAVGKRDSIIEGPLVAQKVKCLPAMQETWVQFPWSGRSPGKGNGNPLQYFCLENSMDGGAC